MKYIIFLCLMIVGLVNAHCDEYVFANRIHGDSDILYESARIYAIGPESISSIKHDENEIKRYKKSYFIEFSFSSVHGFINSLRPMPEVVCEGNIDIKDIYLVFEIDRFETAHTKKITSVYLANKNFLKSKKTEKCYKLRNDFYKLVLPGYYYMDNKA